VKAEKDFISRIEDLENRLAESEQLVEAIRLGEVDAFALNKNNRSEIYTLHSGDYAYRVLVENFSEGALNLSEDGMIVYTNSYFLSLLRLPYEKIVGYSFSHFVHVDSQESFKRLFQQALTGTSKGEINLHDGRDSIPVYVSLTSLQPNLPTIGIIVTDLTEKRKHEKELAEKNNQLAQSNTELASFSYIASHDLQEPLRKIQTFCNRILDRADHELSPDLQDYFNRILQATARMKNLISDVLNYSRINTREKDFALTDLNVLAQDAKHNLEERMEASRATITIDPLPSVNVIPYQINQLFTNIFSNAIKYRKADATPVVHVMAKIVHANEIRNPDVNTVNSHYHQISISDNGIGFVQAHAEKIFELFQRLHGVYQYEGTGIGLSICKRILQNHKGFIEAKGSPGVGAVFTFYLPVQPV
jgi:PAS domain S-box-containing protein